MLFWNISSKREFTSLPLNKGSYPGWNAKPVSPWKKSFIVTFSWASLKKKKVFHYFKRKTRKYSVVSHRSKAFFSNVLFASQFWEGCKCSVFIALRAWALDVFIPSSRQFKSGVRCIRAGLLLCQEDYPLMTSQHFHPSEFDLSEAEVALNLHKVTLGTNKTGVCGVIIVPLIACCS